MTNPTSKEPSLCAAAIISVVIALVMVGSAYFISNYQPPKGPSWEPAQAEFKPIATLIPSDSTSVVGTVLPWERVPTTGRHIVLCELIDDTSIPYDCRVTAYHAMTNSGSRFKIDNVLPGKYLIL